ncbi:potassium:proton antiporter [Sinorhizobium fredii USDA 205]|uniref:Na+/H+ antiporter subunit E n=1 Tax=Rhizobium fredii TaxID=380 RepID=A0A2A6LYP4_RHIFR|nr:Na+/H+ antiporter subunit E [Sinorhizobium fredii]KSV90552.1 potassium:proton antiporter [Sinorhizobium fredii USDA 205]MCG5474739.1 Na+/H+ antiporter subunit E [Sinorhizobium fredii]MQW96923.1 Na+/H+ antiporter subunit E [Sinorhizobium fredii]MQX09931.1 Na+/H+ antiporter subunit E [Sinorhizobium fredii]PDT47753.1 Na+/H+ antiporter subunit E [Sinorhizobium fredii]
MRAWYPYPLFSIALFLMWLLLNQSMAPGAIVVGVFLSTLLAWVMVKLQPTQSRLRRLGLMAGFALAVAADIIRSNVAVAGIILRARRRPANTGFMTVDVDLENENALALLACILTATPGTAWLEYDRRQKSLLLHVLDIDNEDLWRRTVKRYEAGLKEILQ